MLDFYGMIEYFNIFVNIFGVDLGRSFNLISNHGGVIHHYI